MTQPTDTRDAPDSAPTLPIGKEPAPQEYDTSPRPEDGPQDVDQTPDYDEAEVDDAEDEDDPEVHEVA